MLQVIVLAGGEGKRMKSEVPKVLHQVGGKFMLQRVLEKVLELGPKKVIVVSGKNASYFENEMKPLIPNDNIHYIPQIPAMGTGDAVWVALPHLLNEGNGEERVLIVNADTPLIDKCLQDIVNGEPPRILVTRLQNPHGQGRILMDDKGVFQGIIEEKDADEHQKAINLVNSGVYLVNLEDLWTIIPKINNNNAQNEYYMTDFFMHVQKQVNLCEVPRERQWELLNVNTPQDLEKALTCIT